MIWSTARLGARPLGVRLGDTGSWCRPRGLACTAVSCASVVTHLDFLVRFSGHAHSQSPPSYDGWVRQLQRHHPKLPVFDWQNTRRYFTSLGIRKLEFQQLLASQGEVRIAALNLLDTPLQTQIVPKAEFLQLLGMSPSEVGQVILTHPEVLSVPVDQMKMIVSRLAADAGLDPLGIIEALQKGPTILTMDPEHNLTVKVAVLRGLHMSNSQIASAIRTDPAIILTPIHRGLLPVAAFLSANHFPQDSISAAFSAFPSLVTCSTTKLDLRIQFMRQQLQLTSEQLCAFPEFLTVPIVSCTGPRHAWLVHRRGQKRTSVHVARRMTRYHVTHDDQFFAHMTHSRCANYLRFKSHWQSSPLALPWAGDC